MKNKTTDSKSMYVHIIALVVGDWSGDGHRQTMTYVIESSVSKRGLEQAYAKGVKKIGFALKGAMEGFESNKLSLAQWQKLAACGLDWEMPKTEEEAENFSCYWDEYFRLYLFFCRVGNPTLQVKQIVNNINIGGYGCFSD